MQWSQDFPAVAVVAGTVVAVALVVALVAVAEVVAVGTVEVALADPA